MKKSCGQRYVYIVISQTGTLLSSLIKLVTGQKYNHASLSLATDLSTMYSFGRMHPYNPVWGGFVRESPSSGTFKRFFETEVMVLAVPVSEKARAELAVHLKEMYRQRKRYHYNYLGLFLGGLHISRKKDRCYYCSEFVRDILAQHQIIPAGARNAVVHPMQFLLIPDARILYEGKLREYSVRKKCPYPAAPGALLGQAVSAASLRPAILPVRGLP